jgi:hypothetical protein
MHNRLTTTMAKCYQKERATPKSCPNQTKTPMSSAVANILLNYETTIVSVAEVIPANGLPSVAPAMKLAAVRSIALKVRV